MGLAGLTGKIMAIPGMKSLVKRQLIGGAIGMVGGAYAGGPNHRVLGGVLGGLGGSAAAASIPSIRAMRGMGVKNAFASRSRAIAGLSQKAYNVGVAHGAGG